MKNIKQLTLILLLAWTATACYREEALTRTSEPENVYSENTLPQGNHPYDADIMDFYTSNNTLILYKYQDQDIYWNGPTSIGAFRWNPEDPNTSSAGYYYSLADENYIDEQLDLIQDKFLRHFSRPEMLEKLLPKKIFLADTFGIRYLTWSGNVVTGVGTFYSMYAYMGIDYMLFTWGGPRIAAMTATDRNTFKYEVFNAFFTKLNALGKLAPPAAFSATTDYSNAWPAAANKPAMGIMPNQNGSLTVTSDWSAYLSVILRTPYDVLTAQRVDPLNTTNFTGYLHPDIDINGKIMEKYTVIINYFNDTFGIDLQGIGNDVEI
jgi:hypothetical protein